MKPTPTPGPIAPKPVASPSSSAFAALTVSEAAIQSLLVIGVDGSTDVDSRERCKDEGLQAGDQCDLEPVDGEAHGEAQWLDEPVEHARCEDTGQGEEHRDDQVARQQVGEKSH